MAPRPHNPNLSEDIQPLIKVDHHVLAVKMEEIVATVSALKAQGTTVLLIYVRLNATAMQVMPSQAVTKRDMLTAR